MLLIWNTLHRQVCVPYNTYMPINTNLRGNSQEFSISILQLGNNAVLQA